MATQGCTYLEANHDLSWLAGKPKQEENREQGGDTDSPISVSNAVETELIRYVFWRQGYR